MFRQRLALTLAAATAAFASALPARAQHRGDVVLDIPNGTVIRTNQFDLNGVLTPGIRVFPSVLGAFAPNFTNTPGFDCVPGTFPVPSQNGFNIRKALRKWNGQGFDRLSGPSVEHIAIAFGPLGPVNSPDCDSPVPGFSLQVGSNAQWHRHLEYTLTGPAATGIYLLELEIYSTDPSIAKTKPFWFVFKQRNPGDFTTDPAALQAQQDAAVAWANAHLVPRLCPADFNASGSISVQDVFDFLASWFALSPEADFNGSCTDTVQDVFDFLAAWFAGCPA